jgi:hypothetical protein
MKTEEEEERHVRLEKRLEPNVDFNDALQVLDSNRISSLEQPWMGAILYGVCVNLGKGYKKPKIPCRLDFLWESST